MVNKGLTRIFHRAWVANRDSRGVALEWGVVMKTVFFSAAALAAVFGATAAQADTTIYNSAPTDGWIYGDGNNYVPANSAVLTTDAGNQLSLRLHETYQTAPASVGGLYSFPLGLPEGTGQLSFDWGIGDGDFSGITALLTLTNLGTGVSWNYDPFFVGNDNTVANGSAQNSFRLNWAPIGFDPIADGLYRVNLDVFGLAGGDKSLFVDAQLGEGVAAVPEPTTWAMMLLGMGLVGAAMRRKAKTTVRVRYA